MKKKIVLAMSLLTMSILTACSSAQQQRVELLVNNDVLTVINILKPEETMKSDVLNLLKEGIDETMTKQKGYISSSVHSSVDNNYIINYSQWRSMDDLAVAGALVNAGGAPKMAEAFSKSNADYHPVKIVAQYKSDDTKKIYIDTKGETLTLINVLIPHEGTSKEALVDMMKEALGSELVTQDGYIASMIHLSMDNNYVINYTQWKNQKSLNAFVKRMQDGDAPKMARVFANSSADFHPYTVDISHFSK